MTASDDHSRLQNLGTVIGAPEAGLRYMRRRRVGTADRNGDPLDGIVNLWDVAIVLAVGFLVAALAAAGVTGLLTSKNMTIVTNPGTPQMQVIVKEGDKITKLDMQSGQEVAGAGTLHRLVLQARRRDRRVRAGGPDRSERRHAGSRDAHRCPGETTLPTTYPTVAPTPGVTAYPDAGRHDSRARIPTPTPGVTLTPDTSGIR